MIDETLLEAEEKMEKAVAHAREEFGTIRTGRATPNMFAKIGAEYYDSWTPLSQLASINIPEPRMAVISPFDKTVLPSIEKAIRDSDLGVNPTSDGNIIRVVFPQLTEERRKDMVKLAKSKAEDARVSVRGVRRHGMDALDKLKKDGDVGEDEAKRASSELDKITSSYVEKIDELLKHKEAELLEV